jgi:hypothetical protein
LSNSDGVVLRWLPPYVHEDDVGIVARDHIAQIKQFLEFGVASTKEHDFRLYRHVWYLEV